MAFRRDCNLLQVVTAVNSTANSDTGLLFCNASKTLPCCYKVDHGCEPKFKYLLGHCTRLQSGKKGAVDQFEKEKIKPVITIKLIPNLLGISSTHIPDFEEHSSRTIYNSMSQVCIFSKTKRWYYSIVSKLWAWHWVVCTQKMSIFYLYMHWYCILRAANCKKYNRTSVAGAQQPSQKIMLPDHLVNHYPYHVFQFRSAQEQRKNQVGSVWIQQKRTFLFPVLGLQSQSVFHWNFGSFGWQTTSN